MFHPLYSLKTAKHYIASTLLPCCALGVLFGISQNLSPICYYQPLPSLPKTRCFHLFSSSFQSSLRLANPLGSHNRALFLWCNKHCNSNTPDLQNLPFYSSVSISAEVQCIVLRVHHPLSLQLQYLPHR